MNSFLPRLLATITRHPRYRPEIDWDANKLFVSKVFRHFENTFGRRVGIRRESAAVWNGEKFVYQLFTLESRLAFAEVVIREMVKELKSYRLVVPVMATPMGFAFTMQPFMFAIANDSTGKDGTGGTGSSKSFTFVNTAGNFLVSDSWSESTNPDPSTMTYNAVSLTKAGSTNHCASPNAYDQVFYSTTAPATGSNTLLTTYNTTQPGQGFFNHIVTYSGCNASSPVANIVQQVTSNIGNDSIAVTITTTASSWAWWVLGNTAGRAYTAGANTTKLTGASDGQSDVFDSGGIASSSPWTLNATITSSTEVKMDTAFELKAAAGVTVNSNFLAFM